jgi:hypothetical protein
MSDLQEIERAVSQLSPEELTAFRNWFAEFNGEVVLQEAELIRSGESYPVWSPYGADKAAETMLEVLKSHKNQNV